MNPTTLLQKCLNMHLMTAVNSSVIDYSLTVVNVEVTAGVTGVESANMWQSAKWRDAVRR